MARAFLLIWSLLLEAVFGPNKFNHTTRIFQLPTGGFDFRKISKFFTACCQEVQSCAPIGRDCAYLTGVRMFSQTLVRFCPKLHIYVH